MVFVGARRCAPVVDALDRAHDVDRRPFHAARDPAFRPSVMVPTEIGDGRGEGLRRSGNNRLDTALRSRSCERCRRWPPDRTANEPFVIAEPPHDEVAGGVGHSGTDDRARSSPAAQWSSRTTAGRVPTNCRFPSRPVTLAVEQDLTRDRVGDQEVDLVRDELLSRGERRIRREQRAVEQRPGLKFAEDHSVT